jgi:hypothetical protein
MSTLLVVLVAAVIAVVLIRRLTEERIACNSCLRVVGKRRMMVLADGRLICKECLNNTISTVMQSAVGNLAGVRDLARRIVLAALRDAEALKSTIHAKDEKDCTKRWFAVVCEFLYFFMHMTSRFAYREFGHERRCKIQDQLYPLIIRPTIEAIFEHWPQNLKDGMESEFIENLGRAEIEYGECKQLLNRDNPLAQDALFSKFAGNVCEQLGAEKTDTAAYARTFMRVLELATNSFNQLDLPECLRSRDGR